MRLPCRGVLSFRSEAREVLGSETPRVHIAARRCGGVAARGAGAAAGNAGDRIPQQRITWRLRADGTAAEASVASNVWNVVVMLISPSAGCDTVRWAITITN